MKDGKCPKCNSKTVFKKRMGVSFSSSSGFYVTISKDWATKSIKDVDHYLCTTCGYLEMYVEDKAKLEQVAKDWTKAS